MVIPCYLRRNNSLLDFSHKSLYAEKTSMFDPISEWLEMFLVNLGIQLSQLSPENTTMVTLFLASLMVAALAARVLPMLILR
jgi:hypothetical protein